MALHTEPFDLAGYRYVRRIGRGGMATVYLALQESLKRPVAIKILSSHQIPGERLVARFEQEARTIARLDHPHIVSIFDVGRDNDGQLYYTMPYLPNGDLRGQHLGEDEGRIIEVTRALASALGYAHSQGIVHRDVKPENVLFDALKRPLLADFGIAFSTENSDRLTREGATLGSSGYMSPEQAMGHALDGRSDLYSLGVLCYELLTGDRPFRGPDTLSVALAHLNEPVRRLPPARAHWQTIINKTLAKSPADRYQNAAQLLAALDDLDKHGASRLSRVLERLSSAITVLATPLRLKIISAVTLAVFIGVVAWQLFLHTSTTSAAPSLEARNAESNPATNDVLSPAPRSDIDIDIDRLLSEAAALEARGQVTAPPGDNAAERYLMILKVHPENIEAAAALREIFKATLIQHNLLADKSTRFVFNTFMSGAHLAGLHEIDVFDGLLISSIGSTDSVVDSAAISDTNPAAQQAANSGKSRKAAALHPVTANVSAEKRAPSAGEHIRDSAGPDLVYVPEDLTIGTGHDAVPQPFAVAATDVTRGQYAEFARASGRTESPCREPLSLLSRLRDLSWRNPGFVQDDAHPVVCISWQDAQAYAHWLSQRTGKHYRLPTQQEWLHVARQLTTKDACASGNVGDQARGGIGRHFDCNDGYAHTSPVGSFPASPLGIADLSGNVSIWMGDCANKNCGEVWFRGLSWRDGPGDANVERKGRSAADVGYTTIGLRVMRNINE